MSGFLTRFAATFVAPPAEPREERRGRTRIRADRTALAPAPGPSPRPEPSPPAQRARPEPSPPAAVPRGAPSSPEAVARTELPPPAGAPPDEPSLATVGPPAASVGVLARPSDAWAAGGAVALGMLGSVGASVAVLVVWGAGPGPSATAPAVPGARRLAGRLAERGHDVHASGRLVLVALGDGIVPACAEAARIAAAAGDVPIVTVLAGARDARGDALLGEQDRVVVVASDPEDAIAELAAASLDCAGAPVRILVLPAAAPARALAVTGVALLAPLRPAVEEALR